MNKSLQSYSPIVLPLDYDSIKSANGCQLLAGTGYKSLLPFEEICAFNYDPSDINFSLPDVISYFKGPVATGVSSQPFRYDWAAWVATRGVRIARSGSISLPSDVLGATYGLYPTTKPEKVYGAFNANGFPVVAIQKDATHIEIKRITDGIGTISTSLFAGLSPVLLFNGLLVRSDVGGNTEVVCLYLDLEDREAIYARFESENFATGHAINLDLPVTLTRLISTKAKNFRQVIYAKDNQNRDITINSQEYKISTSIKSNLNIEIDDGLYLETAVTSNQGEEKSQLLFSFDSGNYFDAALSAPSLTTHKANFGITLVEGEYA